MDPAFIPVLYVLYDDWTSSVMSSFVTCLMLQLLLCVRSSAALR